MECEHTPRTLDPTLGDVIAFDPSIRSAGIAHFAGGRLRSVGRFTCAPESGESDGARALRMAQKAASWVTYRGIVPRIFASEYPQIYGVGVSVADPKTIVPMAAVVGFVGGMLFSVAAASNVGYDCITYLPSEWKQGTRNKEEIRHDIKTNRLKPDELALMPATLTDEWDAVGVGLFLLGRFKPIRMLPGAE